MPWLCNRKPCKIKSRTLFKKVILKLCSLSTNVMIEQQNKARFNNFKFNWNFLKISISPLKQSSLGPKSSTNQQRILINHCSLKLSPNDLKFLIFAFLLSISKINSIFPQFNCLFLVQLILIISYFSLNQQKVIIKFQYKIRFLMIAYIAIIGFISTISCILIIICLNSKSNQDNFPSDGNKSPFKKQGLSDSQKSQLLLIVCVIFFMSMVTTNVKTSKFSVMFSFFWQQSEQSNYKHSYNIQQLFFGKKGKCNFNSQTNNYENWMKYLEKSGKKDQLIQSILTQNYKIAQLKQQMKVQSYQNQQLVLFYSQKDSLGANIVFQKISQQICSIQQQKTPVLYIDIPKPVRSQQQFNELFNIQSYQSLKNSICKLNGIDIKKQTQKIGNYYIQKEVYIKSQNRQRKRPNFFLIINNFQYLFETIIMRKSNLHFNQPDDDYLNGNKDQINPQNLVGPHYKLFIDLLFSQLIQNCQTNVILHTHHKQSINRLYNFWKISSEVNMNRKRAEKMYKLNRFPFTINSWKGLNKIQFYEFLKANLQSIDNFKQKQNIVWKTFSNHFGSISGPQKKKINLSSSDRQEKVFIQNSQDLSFEQIQRFFIQLQNSLSQSEKESQSRKIKLGKSNQIYSSSLVKYSMAKFYGLQDVYLNLSKIIKTSIQAGQYGVDIGRLKRKINLEKIQKLEQLKLISIKQGKAYLQN